MAQEDENVFKVVFKPVVSGLYSFDISVVDANGLPAPVKGSPFKIDIQAKLSTYFTQSQLNS